ncbi:hypothetical protein Fcan01_23793, partial [Folsomia candida]
VFQAVSVAVAVEKYMDQLTTTIFGDENPVSKWRPDHQKLWGRLKWDSDVDHAYTTSKAQDLLRSYDVSGDGPDDSFGAYDCTTNGFLASLRTPANVEITCTAVFKFFCIDSSLDGKKISTSMHYFFCNYDFLFAMRDENKTYLFIPITFGASYFRDFLPLKSINSGHATFVLVDTIQNLVAFYDPNYNDKFRYIYTTAIVYVAEQLTKIWGRTFKIRDSTEPRYSEFDDATFTLKEFKNRLHDLFPYMADSREGRRSCKAFRDFRDWEEREKIINSKINCLNRLNEKARKRAHDGILPKAIDYPIQPDHYEPDDLRKERDQLNQRFFASVTIKHARLQ